MKEQETRRDAYSYSPQVVGGSQNSALYESSTPTQSAHQNNQMQPSNINRMNPPMNGAQNSSTRHRNHDEAIISVDSDSDGFGFTQSSQLLHQQNSLDSSILTSRATAIDSIEQTIAELGQIYQHFALLLSQQRDSVLRIDDSIRDVEGDVEGAHGELVRYYDGMGGNRMLMVKAFGAILLFFLMYTVFFS